MTRPYRVVLFDLFGTVVHFVPPPPDAARMYEWLRGPFEQLRPDLPFDDFRRALREVSAAMHEGRAPEHREHPSRERFRRALERFDATPDPAIAETLSLAHMAHLSEQTEMPASHLELLRALSARYRLGLVSNFDHAPTAQAILARYDVHRCFDVTLISDDYGRRKPHPSIFEEALFRLGVTPAEALYVGDSAADDVVGAQGIGLDVAWINRSGDEPPDPPPTHELRVLADLRALLGI